VALGLRVNERIAVHFRSAGKKITGLLGASQTKRVMRAKRVYFERFDRQLQVVDRAGRTGEVNYPIEIIYKMNVVAHVMVDELKTRISLMRSDVVEIAGD